MTDPAHLPVLPEEILALLHPESGDVVVDCTAGRGGHALLLGQHLDASGTIILLDLDQLIPRLKYLQVFNRKN